MSLFTWLRPPSDLPAVVEALQKRVADLESLQVGRELEWVEVKDKLLRYLKRVQELQRRGDNGEQEQDLSSRSRSLLMAMKFPQHNQGG